MLHQTATMKVMLLFSLIYFSGAMFSFIFVSSLLFYSVVVVDVVFVVVVGLMSFEFSLPLILEFS